jgi:hypothetical protein
MGKGPAAAKAEAGEPSPFETAPSELPQGEGMGVLGGIGKLALRLHRLLKAPESPKNANKCE